MKLTDEQATTKIKLGYNLRRLTDRKGDDYTIIRVFYYGGCMERQELIYSDNACYSVSDTAFTLKDFVASDWEVE